MRVLPNCSVGASPAPASKRIIGPALLIAACAFVSAPAGAANTAFLGPLEIVFEDTGTGLFAGAQAGDPFFGQFTFGDTAAEAFETTLEPTEAGWEFLSQSVSLSNGVNAVSGSESFVTIQDNFALDEDEAGLVSLLLGTIVAEGTLADSYAVSGLEAGAFEAGDDEELVFNGILFEVIYLSLDTSLINGLAYDPTPPGLDEVDAAIYTIIEGDSEGNVVFQALGLVETTVIPIPAAAWLFGSALGLLGLLRRRFA